MSLVSINIDQPIDDNVISMQAGFGYFILWLSIWFQALSLIFYKIEYSKGSPFRRFGPKEPIGGSSVKNEV